MGEPLHQPASEFQFLSSFSSSSVAFPLSLPLLGMGNGVGERGIGERGREKDKKSKEVGHTNLESVLHSFLCQPLSSPLQAPLI